MSRLAPFGQTLAEALTALERRGFRASFRTLTEGHIACLICEHTSHADAFPMLAFERVEGVSDPADQNLVAGLACPACGARGTLVLPYGALATRRDAHVLSHMHPVRTPTIGSSPP